MSDEHTDALAETHAAPLPRPAAPHAPGPRYEVRDTLGRGGMGVVELCHDARIDRDVARKSMLAPESGAEARFLREALVQARLEHPVFVPVYDVEPAEPSFTMRRVRGRSLREVLAAGDVGRSRLMRAFVELCLAVDYAHSRGVLHRDIKPENVMLGDFGEVYLLDWGIARVHGAADDAVIAPSAGGTAEGAVLGTLGYMPPEQLRGDHAALDARADVYALGAVLYEVVAREPMHARTSVGDLIASTLDPAEHRPSRRGADVPAELDDLVARATASDREARVPSARALAEAVERVLDGERDARARAARAEALATEARRRLDAEPTLVARIEAGRAASRALALDAGNAVAREVLVASLVVADGEAPEQAKAAAEATRAAAEVRTAVEFGRMLVAFLASAIVLFSVAGVYSWPFVAAFVALNLSAAGVLMTARVGPTQERRILAGFVLLALANALGTRRTSPWITIPMVMLGNGLLFGLHARPGMRRALTAVATATVLLPAFCDELGLVIPSYEQVPGGLLIHTRVIGAPSWMLFLYTAALIGSGGQVVVRALDHARQVEVRMQSVAWTIRKIATPAGDDDELRSP